MDTLKSHVKANLAYGLLAALPVAIIGLAIHKLIEILGSVATYLGLDSAMGATLVVVVALVGLLLLIYQAGAFICTQVGSWSFEKIELKVLKQIPGYSIISGILKGFVESGKEYQPALISLYQPGASVLGFVMEKNPDDTMTVFVPSTPALTVGSIHIVSSELVTLLDASHLETANCITDWGIGAHNVATTARPEA